MEPKAVSNTSQVRQDGDGNFCPLRDLWWNMGHLDSTAICITLADVSRVFSQKYLMEPKESAEAIALYTGSIQCLQKRLQTPVDGLSEGVIVSVIEFAYYDVRRLIFPIALREILTQGQVSSAGSRPMACPYGWSRQPHSAERWHSDLIFI